MLAHLEQLVETVEPPWQKHLAREYLQARILSGLQAAGAMSSIAFHGGTAQRFLFDLDRFSEDLDFALAFPERYDLTLWLRETKRRLTREGFDPEIRIKDDRVVQVAWFRFSGLPFRLGFSQQESETLRIKLEVDTNPPAGAAYEVTPVRRHAPLRLFHHDRPTLLAGKLHAVLQRSYAKGRDFYDLAWYLGDRRWPEPNLAMLRSALRQTGWQGDEPTESNWRHLVLARLDKLEWDRVRADVEPFLETPESLEWVEPETLKKLLAR